MYFYMQNTYFTRYIDINLQQYLEAKSRICMHINHMCDILKKLKINVWYDINICRGFYYFSHIHFNVESFYSFHILENWMAYNVK